MNYSRYLIIGALVLTLSLPPALHAQVSTSDVQAQINRLLQQIKDLQAQILQLQSTASGPTTASVPPGLGWRHRICLVSRQLQEGDENDDVRALQEFLRDEGLLSANATGYFGIITREALRKWQARNLGLTEGDAATTGWGAFGPRTRAFLARWCGGNELGVLRASPQRGSAPLAVTFTTTEQMGDPTRVADLPGLKIVFGDGSQQPLECDRPDPPNATSTNGNLGSSLDRPASCPVKPVAHTYSANGTYTASLVRYGGYCAGSCPETTLARTQVFVGTEGNRPPTISSFSGPTTLSLNQSGTWTIAASDPENAQLSYQVRWGDEGAFGDLLSLAGLQDSAFVQQTTFTHSYSRAGTFTVSIVVRDAAGQTARTSTTVRVGTPTTENIIACTQDAYQCPNGQWVGRTGPYCQFVCGGQDFGVQPEARYCTHAGRTYEEGSTYTVQASCIANSGVGNGNFTANCSDTYICRSGTWVASGSQTDGRASCRYAGTVYEHGAVAPCNGIISGDQCAQPQSFELGTAAPSDYRNVCVNGSWQRQ